jgi:hypothetical protein
MDEIIAAINKEIEALKVTEEQINYYRVKVKEWDMKMSSLRNMSLEVHKVVNK